MLARNLLGLGAIIGLTVAFSGCKQPCTFTVSFTDPAHGSANVAINAKLAATFSGAADPSTINQSTFLLFQGNTQIDGVVDYTGVTATFAPTGGLMPNTPYTAVITKDTRAVKALEAENEPEDKHLALLLVFLLARNAGECALAEDYAWTFTTGPAPDATAPAVVSTNPESEAQGVPTNQNIAATFSESMDPATIDTDSFKLSDGVQFVTGTVSSSGNNAVFDPDTNLTPGTGYTATITTAASDLAGNGLAAEYMWTFTAGAGTDDSSPAVTATSPIDGAEGVPINSQVSATFDEAMNPLTLNSATFTVTDGVTPVSGTVSYAGMTATFTPDSNLTADTTYTATIDMAASDLAGNTLASDFVWTFTTGVATAQEPIELGTTNSFAILAGSSVNNSNISSITGDVGVSPGTAVDGFPPGIINGSIFTGAGSAAGQAKIDLTAAFDEAVARSTGSVSLPGDLGGLTIYPGLYTNSSSVMISTGILTLDAQGDENAVFLFKMGSTLTTSTATQVVLSGGAKANNVYWQVGSSATLGTGSTFKGNILAQESITLTSGVNLEGRALTQTAAVTTDAVTIVVPAP